MQKNEPPTSPFRSDVLKGKVALVTGGASGIGFGISTALGKHGAKVVVVGRREEVLKEAVKKLKSGGVEASHVQGDVRSYESIKGAIDETVRAYGRLDILVNCAAGNFLSPAKDLTPNGFKTVIDIDLNGTFNASRAAFEALKASGDGLIINITATLGYTSTHWQIHASAAKCGIDAMTRNLGVEWGPHGIRVVGIAPGPIQGTEGMSRLSGAIVDPKKLDHRKESIPIGRGGYVEDIALTSVFLATSAAGFITGETIVVDGGNWLYREPFVSESQIASITAALKDKKQKSAL